MGVNLVKLIHAAGKTVRDFLGDLSWSRKQFVEDGGGCAMDEFFRREQEKPLTYARPALSSSVNAKSVSPNVPFAKELS